MKCFLDEELFWIRKPEHVKIDGETIEITTLPKTDLWQRTYYGFQNDNAPLLQIKTEGLYFSFVVKTTFESKHRFDQRNVVSS